MAQPDLQRQGRILRAGGVSVGRRLPRARIKRCLDCAKKGKPNGGAVYHVTIDAGSDAMIDYRLFD